MRVALAAAALCVAVVEVCYDHFSGDRFRHGTRLLRWRPDETPEQCTPAQVRQRKADVLSNSLQRVS
jgi:hypothetical protein